MQENPLVPKAVRAPGLKWRNIETLRRLAYIAERRRDRAPEAGPGSALR